MVASPFASPPGPKEGCLVGGLCGFLHSTLKNDGVSESQWVSDDIPFLRNGK
jgi:hypothetical protein